jgi:hypothetical protein
MNLQDLTPRGGQWQYEDAMPHDRITAWLKGKISMVTHPVASAAVFSLRLLMGPRLVFVSGKLPARSVRLWKLPVETLGPVLGWLVPRTSSVSREEVLRDFPGLAWAQAVADLAMIDGVLLIDPDGNRLTLSDSLRAELSAE